MPEERARPIQPPQDQPTGQHRLLDAVLDAYLELRRRRTTGPAGTR